MTRARKKPTHGGARKGAGRPATRAGRRAITIWLDADLLQWLDENLDAPDVGGIDRTHLIATTLAAYRDEVERHRRARS